jgi:SAM-dependent methyltransferase
LAGRLRLLPLYFRIVEWRVSRRAPPPPRFDERGIPIPPRLLITRVAGEPDWRGFLKNGADNVASIERFAREGGIDIVTAARTLDFGCGCGRVVRHLPARTATAVFGVDRSASLIRWCAHNLAGDFRRSAARPPLDFPDAHFDLVYLISVFTHMSIDAQRAWLREFRRIARPGAVVLVTFQDEYHRQLVAVPGARAELQRTGSYVLNGWGEGSNLFATFQTRAAATDLFGEVFDVVRIVPAEDTGGLGQTLAILRRRAAA